MRVARKRRFGITSQVRYKLKLYRLFGEKPPQELINEFASAVDQAYHLSYGEYYKVRRKVMNSEVWAKVPTALRGLYLAYVNEVVNKVMTRGIASLDEVVAKWSRMGLDEGLLYEIAEVIGLEKPEVEEPKPAPKP